MPRPIGNAGFTLAEVLVALAILSIVVWIVYASLDQTMRAAEETRLAMSETKLRLFLGRHLRQSFATVFTDAAIADEAFAFTGEDDEGPYGPADSVRFVCLAPASGGTALPGDLKEVRYGMPEGEHASDFRFGAEEEDMGFGFGGGEEEEEEFAGWEEEVPEGPWSEFVLIEVPLLRAGVDGLDTETGAFEYASDYEPLRMRVAMRSFSIEYFDGEEWVAEWDSRESGRLPWYVRIGMNFARTEEEVRRLEREEGVDFDEDPDFQAVIPIPMGAGLTQDMRNELGAGPGGEPGLEEVNRATDGEDNRT